MHPVPLNRRKPLPRKVVGGLLTGAAILIAGRFVDADHVTAVVTGLVSVYGIFATGHVLGDLQAGKSTNPKNEEGS
jgi:hypothetical protein